MRVKILLFFDQGGNWSKVIHFNFITMVNFKSSGFDKETGGKSGKFQFDCDSCILFTRHSINITNSFSFYLYNLPFFYTVFRSRVAAYITEADFIIEITQI